MTKPGTKSFDAVVVLNGSKSNTYQLPDRVDEHLIVQANKNVTEPKSYNMGLQG